MTQRDIHCAHLEASAIADLIDDAAENRGDWAYVLLRDIHQHVEAHPQFVPTTQRTKEELEESK